MRIILLLLLTFTSVSAEEYGKEYQCDFIIAMLQSSAIPYYVTINKAVDEPVEYVGVHNNVPFHWLFVVNSTELTITFQGEGADPSDLMLSHWDKYVDYIAPKLEQLSNTIDHIVEFTERRNTGRSCLTNIIYANKE